MIYRVYVFRSLAAARPMSAENYISRADPSLAARSKVNENHLGQTLAPMSVLMTEATHNQWLFGLISTLRRHPD